MSILGSGEVTFVVATVYFAVFAVIHVAIAVAHRRLEGAPPRDARRRTKLSWSLAGFQFVKAVWFAVLFTVAGITVIDATPRLPLLEVITVYGGIIGVVFSLMQATEWVRVAQRTLKSHSQLQHLALEDGEIVHAEMVTVRMPATMRDRLIAGEPLTIEDHATLRAANPDRGE